MTEEDILSVAGTNDEETIRIFTRKFGPDFPVLAIHQRHNELKEGWADTEGVPVKSGLSEALIGLRALHIPMAVATSTRRGRAEKLLRAVGVLEYFSGVVCGSDVKKQPSPRRTSSSRPALNFPSVQKMRSFSKIPPMALQPRITPVSPACISHDMVVLSEDTLSLTAAACCLR